MADLKTMLINAVPRSYRVRYLNHRLRKEIDEHPERALIVWARDNSSRMFYVFHGMAGRLGMQPLTVFRETGLMHANLILLKDYYRLFYHLGLNRDIPDFDAIVARLRKCREDLPFVEQTYSFGTSIGGYAAILFGHYLKVDTVFGFGPATWIDLDYVKKLRGPKDLDRIPEGHRNLAGVLANHNGKTRYKIFYCEDFDQDRNYAENIRGLPGVELYPQPGNTHAVMQVIHSTGRLREIFDGVEPAMAASN